MKELNHGYILRNCQVTKSRPYDDNEYYWAIKTATGKAQIIKSGKIVDEIAFEDVNEIADFLKMINSTISPIIVR